MNIPFLDLGRQIAGERSDIDAAFNRVLVRGNLLLGEELVGFESEFAEWNGIEHVVGVSSGCTAIALLLQAAGVGIGDEVVVPGFTCPATWMGVCMSGARPVAVDVDARTMLLDPGRLSEVRSLRTKAVLVVHLYGSVCAMDELREFCRKQNLWLFVDAAQSTGGRFNGSRAAALGDGAAFSFYPTKNLAALDDAGAVATASEELADAIISLRNYGKDKKGNHQLPGINARMGELQAAVLRMRLGKVESDNLKRRQLAEIYLSELNGLTDVILPVCRESDARHLFAIRVNGRLEREELSAELARNGVATAIHYQEAFSTCQAFGLNPVPLPISEELADTVLSLPLNPWMSPAEVRYVAGVIREWYKT